MIFAVIGHRIKIRQVGALQKNLETSDFDGSLENINFEAVWGFKSGCSVSRLTQSNDPVSKSVGIFKEGTVKKIKKEQAALQQWKKRFPGLVPDILGYDEKGNSASLLLEFLPGCTAEKAIQAESAQFVAEMNRALEKTIRQTWCQTLSREPLKTDYMSQLKTRFEAVIKSHPAFNQPKHLIGPAEILSTLSLIDHCEQIECGFPAPYTVLIHGDFNTNNLLYHTETGEIHYVDLYRSRQADYVQDASVFLISCFRTPNFHHKQRSRINSVIKHFYRLFSDIAQENRDDTFEIRMALALARSFFTSTRFEKRSEFAEEMRQRAVFLMEKIVSLGASRPEQFKLPEQILYCS
ncbi:MAG: phosphotransferase [SAR324 cluster bacterium]|nr:phosphotransferase [SAR324 cluster bacterium]